MKLGSWLIARGKISGVQLKRALLDQSFYGGYLSSSLMKLGYVDESTLGDYLAETFRVPYAPSRVFADISPEVLRVIPESIAAKYRLVPLAIVERKLQVAMMNPRDLLIQDEVAFLTGLQLEAWVASESVLLEALEKYYQVPRPVRETIPLADQGDDDLEEKTHRPPPPPPAPPDLPARSRALREELGLDGRPLSAPAELVEERQLRPSVPVPPAVDAALHPLPRSIEEWRDQDAEPREAHAAPVAASPAAAVAPVSADSRAGRPPLTLVQTPPRGPLEEVSQKLRNSLSRDEVFGALVEFCAGRFARAALFVVMQEKVIGWGGRGEGLHPDRVRSTNLSFSAPSIFSYFRMGSDFYFGPIPEIPSNQQFYRDLGILPPDRVLLIPILIKGRLIALLYGDHGAGRREEPDIALFRRVSLKASLALEILILRNKIEMI
jgi:type II secretion system (T2SS) protein E